MCDRVVFDFFLFLPVVLVWLHFVQNNLNKNKPVQLLVRLLTSQSTFARRCVLRVFELRPELYLIALLRPVGRRYRTVARHAFRATVAERLVVAAAAAEGPRDDRLHADADHDAADGADPVDEQVLVNGGLSAAESPHTGRQRVQVEPRVAPRCRPHTDKHMNVWNDVPADTVYFTSFTNFKKSIMRVDITAHLRCFL